MGVSTWFPQTPPKHPVYGVFPATTQGDKIATAKPRYSRSASGVTRIKRDSYGDSWYTIAASVRQRDQFKCVFCMKSEDMKSDPKVYHDVHHLIPVERGGRTILSNLVTICKTCHARRHPHLSKAGYGRQTKRPFK